jgi:RNA polymerase sigma factor (sigma-70 family)
MERNGDIRELLQGCISKDKRSWDVFVERYSKLVYWAIRDRLKRCGYDFNEEDINDIHQDVFVALWEGEKLRQLRDPERVAGWISMVAGNAAVDHFRSAKRALPPGSVSIHEAIFNDGEGGSGTLEDLLPARMENPDRQAQFNEARAVLDAAIESLRPRDKMVVKLNLLHGMKHIEIAEAVKMPVNTVSTTIARAKKYLKEKLEKERPL